MKKARQLWGAVVQPIHDAHSRGEGAQSMHVYIHTYLSEVSVSTGHFGVRVHDSDSDVWQDLATLHEGDAVRGTSLQHHHTVHPQGTLVHVHTGWLWVLGALRRRELGILHGALVMYIHKTTLGP